MVAAPKRIVDNMNAITAAGIPAYIKGAPQMARGADEPKSPLASWLGEDQRGPPHSAAAVGRSCAQHAGTFGDVAHALLIGSHGRVPEWAA